MRDFTILSFRRRRIKSKAGWRLPGDREITIAICWQSNPLSFYALGGACGGEVRGGTECVASEWYGDVLGALVIGADGKTGDWNGARSFRLTQPEYRDVAQRKARLKHT
ncbi:hypothetical protein KCP75_12505 [Salmonella enterica subsp. enterica]|nr:hypothetical protein KCP75_12505 [Salmonella enterica subsp. enterica]